MTDTSSDALEPQSPIVESLGTKQVECPSHGMYETRGTRYTVGRGKEVWSPCPACAKEREDAERAELLLAEQERQQARLEELLGRAAIPARFLGCAFENYRVDLPAQQVVLDTCMAFAEAFPRLRKTGESLVLIGRRGTGKTHLAAAILQALLPDHVGLYTTAQDMIAMIRATWGPVAERSTESVMRVLYGVPLLVIDEVGVQAGTDNEQNLLFQVLDHRYRERKPVVLVGNMQIRQMQEMLGERVHDRLREIAQVRVCDWESYRPTARKNKRD